MTPTEAVERIHQCAWVGQNPGLTRIGQLLEALGSPQEQLKFVHIAGTNGKGSTAAMTASILTQAGLRTGLYTSPHLWRFHERFQIDGVPMGDEALVEIAGLVLETAGRLPIRPTEFELMTAMGMVYFAREGCDIVVLEVGLGGRLDSTNIISPPEVAVITNIGLEHTQLLGDTVGKIAGESCHSSGGSHSSPVVARIRATWPARSDQAAALAWVRRRWKTKSWASPMAC